MTGTEIWPAEPVTATDRAYKAVRSGILDGVYSAGQPLREEELADAVGVSRTPIREALRRLDAEGFVEFLPHRGARVATWSEHDLDEIFQLRVQLEGYGARLAAAAITPQAVERLSHLTDSIEQAVSAGGPERFTLITDLNNRFHQEILALGGNDRLTSVLSAVVQRALVARTFSLYLPHQLERSCHQHRELIEALAEHDADWAEAVMRAHLYAGRQAARGVTR